MKAGYVDSSTIVRRSRGFTLLEVMVALAVLAIALISIYRLHAQTLTMSARTRFLSQAPLLAQQKLAEVERRDLRDVQSESGVFGPEQPHYSWKVEVEELRSETLLKETKYHLARIDIDVRRDEDEHYQLRTYRFFTD